MIKSRDIEKGSYKKIIILSITGVFVCVINQGPMNKFIFTNQGPKNKLINIFNTFEATVISSIDIKAQYARRQNKISKGSKVKTKKK